MAELPAARKPLNLTASAPRTEADSHGERAYDRAEGDAEPAPEVAAGLGIMPKRTGRPIPAKFK